MALVLHDNLSRSKRPFIPLRTGAVSLYVCGPTVYSDAHIGHLMGPVVFDASARWFSLTGHQVRFVNNITDIDDKIIHKAQETGEDWRELVARCSAQYFGLLRALGVTSITDFPRCTAYIPEMITFICDLIGRGRAYTAGDGVYFDVQKQPGYGRLSGRSLEDMLAGARIERRADLHHPADFALWKLAKPGEPSWPSPWGEGRPGWHIECSVMSSALLGGAFDIHGGGDDLKFPHHENEIAQSEAHGDRFAQFWLHNGLTQFQGVKISKSDPRNADPGFANQFKAIRLVERWGGALIRFKFLRGHYRRPVDFAPEHLEADRKALERLQETIGNQWLAEPARPHLESLLARRLHLDGLEACRRDFCAALDDDLNTGLAITSLFTIQDLARKHPDQPEARILLRDLGRCLGLFEGPAGGQSGSGVTAASDPADRILASLAAEPVLAGCLVPGDLAATVDRCLAARLEAKRRRDFATADRIRDLLKTSGLVLKDEKDGRTTWTLA